MHFVQAATGVLKANYRVIVRRMCRPLHRRCIGRRLPAAARRPEIAQHKDLMYMAEGVAHCLLFVDSKTGDGLLVEAEGYDYARNSHFVPNAKAILENNEITNEERQLHRSIMAMADRGGVPPLASVALCACGTSGNHNPES